VVYRSPRLLLTRWPPQFLRTSEAARILALSARTLEKHRCYGTGPKYRKLGGRGMYGLADLKAWADLGIKESTSDPGSGSVLPAKSCSSSRREKRAGQVDGSHLDIGNLDGFGIFVFVQLGAHLEVGIGRRRSDQLDNRTIIAPAVCPAN
jgi:hypothetical protein